MGDKAHLSTPSVGKKSTLDKEYYNYIESQVKVLSEDELNRWEIYDIIMDHLFGLNNGKYIKEIKYRITDGENPNKVLLEIINKESDNVDDMIWFFKRRLEEYVDDDYYRRFFK